MRVKKNYFIYIFLSILAPVFFLLSVRVVQISNNLFFNQSEKSPNKIININREFILKKISELSPQEKKDLTNFFRISFHSFEFGYTIFGEKPMSLDALDLEQTPFEDLEDEYKNSEWFVWDYRKKNGWDVWKKHFQDIPLKGFSLIFYPVPGHPKLIHFDIINHKNLLGAIEENIIDIQKILNREMSANEILKEYIKGEGEVFESIKNHDGLLGILLGFGKENSLKYMSGEKLVSSVDISEIELIHNDLSKVMPPLFMVVKGSEETNKIMSSFRKQQEEINKIYQQENFLELVLLRLFCPDEFKNTPH